MKRLKKIIRTKLLGTVDTRIAKLDKEILSLSDKVGELTKVVDVEKKLRIQSNRALISNVLPKSIFVCTIPKSGTTYTINFLANYVTNLHSQDPDRIIFDDLIENGVFHTVDTPLLMSNVDDIGLYSSAISSILTNQNKISSNSEFSHIIGTHKYHSSYVFNKAIFLYRNPLDFLVSIYNFEYVKKGIDKPFSECVKEKLSGSEFSFVERYKQQKKLCADFGALHVSYENIMKDPRGTFSTILNYLDIPVIEDNLELALEYSSIDSVKEQEQKSGKILLGSERGLKGSFITSGKIGQWNDYFDDALLTYVKTTLDSHGVNFDDFIYA